MSDRLPDGLRFIQRGWANANSIWIEETDARGGAPSGSGRAADPTGFDGPRDAVLIETGSARDAETLASSLRESGSDLERLGLLVNTHGHWDHAGGNAWWIDRTGADLATGPITARWMIEECREELWLDYFDLDMPLRSPNRILEPGSITELGGIPFEVLALPGHAPDLIGLHQPDMRLAITADALLPGGDCGILHVGVHGWECLDEAEDSVRRLQALGLRTVLPGHGPIIGDPVSELEQLGERLARFREEPRRLIGHLARRVAVAGLLEAAPITETAYRERAIQSRWARECAELSGRRTESMVEELLDGLKASGAIGVTESAEGDLLVARVPR